MAIEPTSRMSKFIIFLLTQARKRRMQSRYIVNTIRKKRIREV